MKKLFDYKPYWAECFGVSPFLPTSKQEMEALGWDSCDVILVTGDAYVDHPSFGMALIGRLLEAQGFRVGVIDQPNWTNTNDFKKLGRPNLFFGVTSGNMDSMVNRYTADRKIRSDDAYSPDAKPNMRPDRATIVYSQRCKQAYKNMPVIIGGIEASMRRFAHYDYWSDKVRRSILLDSKADLLLYGNAERALVDVAHRLARGDDIKTINDLRGTVFIASEEFVENYYGTKKPADPELVQLLSYDKIKEDKLNFAKTARQIHLSFTPAKNQILAQQYDKRLLAVMPSPVPLNTDELDYVYDLPYSRVPHPKYKNCKMPAYEMIKFSVNILRGCFGGCAFCSIAAHEGRVIQNRSEESIISEVEKVRDLTPGFTGIISDLGGPSANMYRLACKNQSVNKKCQKFSCLYPSCCANMSVDHSPLIQLYRKVRAVDGIKKVLVASGIRYDLAIKDPDYVKELAKYHVGGYLKIAPEHVVAKSLSYMLKPGMDCYYEFKKLFDEASKEVNKKQYLIPYFIAAHPGSTDDDMKVVSQWLRSNDYRLDKVQNFLPTPMSLSTAMYYTGKNPLKKITENSEEVFVAKGDVARRRQKRYLRYHDV